MKKLITLLGIGILLVACYSNSRTHECVKQIVSFVENHKDSCANYSIADWDQANAAYIELLKEAKKYEDNLSISEKRDIAWATTTYVLIQRHRSKEEFRNSLQP